MPKVLHFCFLANLPAEAAARLKLSALKESALPKPTNITLRIEAPLLKRVKAVLLDFPLNSSSSISSFKFALCTEQLVMRS